MPLFRKRWGEVGKEVREESSLMEDASGRNGATDGMDGGTHTQRERAGRAVRVVTGWAW